MCDSATSELLLEGQHRKSKPVGFTDTNKFTHAGSNVNVCRKFIKICKELQELFQRWTTAADPHQLLRVSPPLRVGPSSFCHPTPLLLDSVV